MRGPGGGHAVRHGGLRSGVGAAGALLDLLLPARCLGCGDRIAHVRDRGPVCSRCRSRLRPPPHPRCGRCGFPLGTGRPPSAGCLACADWAEVLRAGTAAAVLEPPADALVHALKYGGWREVAPVMARTMLAAFRELDPDPEAILVPVPTTRRRRRRRGYNQAEILARAVGSATGRRVVRALVRDDRARTQVALGPRARRDNVSGAFRLGCDPGETASRAVLLVDDVLTTGATASAAARALERGGVTGVSVLAFARAVPTPGARPRGSSAPPRRPRNAEPP